MSRAKTTQSDQRDSQALVEVPAQRKPPTLQLSADASVDQWHHNFDLTTLAGRDALINASNVPDWIPADGTTCTMHVVHYLVFPDTYLDRQTGEIVDVTSLVFVGRDGRTAKFRNDWSLRRLHACMRLYTPEEWSAGIPIECYRAPSREVGKMYGSFRVVARGDSTKGE